MKIVAGLGSIDEYIRLAEAGADEFFCGYVPFEWIKTYGILSPLNRREVLYYNVQIGTFSDMVILSRMVEQYKVPVKITLNSLYYTKEQYPMIASLIKDCMGIGFDTFIIADLALILYLREHQIDCKIHLSGETAEVNRAMMEQLNPFQIKRYIFHRKNSIENMESCIANNPVKGLEYEAFILNEMCQFTGAFCNSLHCDELTHMCKVPYQMARFDDNVCRFPEVFHKFQLERQEVENEEIENQEIENHEVENQDQLEFQQCAAEDEEADVLHGYVTGSTGCGLCALKKLKSAGVTHLKLVGRGNYVDYMERDIRQLKKAIKLQEDDITQEDFEKRMKEELFIGPCSKNCYYNEKNIG